MNSYVITWEDPTGAQHRNQVYAPDRDTAIWRLALKMMTANPDSDTSFVSCEPETAENTPGRARS